MHMMGRTLMVEYPEVVISRDSADNQYILANYNHRREVIPDINYPNTLSVIDYCGETIPLTIIDADMSGLGLYFFFKRDSRALLAFRLRYHSPNKYDYESSRI